MKTPAKLPTIQKRLLLSVNGVLLGFVILFLYLDYRSTLSNQLVEKLNSLTEEAKTILPGVIHLQHHGTDMIQEYINDVCDRMEGTQSPFHHIGVKIESELLQSEGHHSQSLRLDELLRSQVNQGLLDFSNKRFALGVQSESEVTVFVIEEVSHIESAAQIVVGQHFFAILTMSLMAAFVVNTLLFRLVNQPITSLVEQVREIGSGNFETIPKQSRTQEFNFLSAEVNKMSEALAAASRERKASLERATSIQLNLLPNDFDELGGIDIAHFYRPAEEVGGDFFDVRNCGDNRWFICVADSAGHGVPAAMSAAMIKALLFKPVEMLANPAKLLAKMNRQFMSVHPYGEFATIFLAFADLDTGELVYMNAGHGSGWLFADNSTSYTELRSWTTPLGIENRDPFNERRARISKNSRLILATDGITESFDENNAMYGTQRFVDQLCASRKSQPAGLVDEIVQSVSDFRGKGRQLDDVTLLIIDFKDSM